MLRANVQDFVENPLREGKLKHVSKLTRVPAVTKDAYDGT